MKPNARTYGAATVKASDGTPFGDWIVNALILRVVDLARRTYYTQITHAQMCKSSMKSPTRSPRGQHENYTYIHIYTHTYIHSYIHTYRHTDIHTYIEHRYIHAYIYTFLHP